MESLATIPVDQYASLIRRFSSSQGEHVLFVPDSRIYDVVAKDHAESSDEITRLVDALAAAFVLNDVDAASMSQVVAPSPQSISLNVSSSCNLSCGYCYAARGNFDGAQSVPMNWKIARQAIDRLLSVADASAPITIGFLGGEPFVNRRLIHQSVAYASDVSARAGLDVRFSVTTNATLLDEEDRQLLRSHPFAVTVSVDGDEITHERQRPFLVGSSKGNSSYVRLRDAIAPLLANPGQARISARTTVTRTHSDLAHMFDSILALGFNEVGFAPLRRGPAGSGCLRDEDWPHYLQQLQTLARRELAHVTMHGTMRLSNLAIALKQLHRGARSPYPCGAGGGYHSVAANGDWYTCHRAIGDADFKVGDSAGLDHGRRVRFLTQRHVHAQTECTTCWARYLCSGGCHQEAAHRTPVSCDFVRDWLQFCLSAYCELNTNRPDWF